MSVENTPGERTEPLDLAAVQEWCRQYERGNADIWHARRLAEAAPAMLAELRQRRAELVRLGLEHAQAAGERDVLTHELATVTGQVERLTFAEGGIRDAAIAYVRAAEDDPELAGGDLYRDLKSAVDHWDAVTARLEAAAESPGGTR